MKPTVEMQQGASFDSHITKLIDDVQWYQTVRELRWPDDVACPACESQEVMKRGFDDTEPAHQRYACHNCDTRFDDLTDTIFAGHHQPLKVWVLCLYFMGLNVSNEQIAHELETVARPPGCFHPARASCKAWSVWSRPSPCASRHISSARRALI